MPIDEATADDPGSEAGLAADVESTMENRGENWKARVVLTKIPNAQRRVIELMYLEHLSLSRVAERLGIPIESVKSRCLEGIGRLREALEATPERLS
jgi:RNA polymerase sigma factor (sigma-70 family)